MVFNIVDAPRTPSGLPATAHKIFDRSKFCHSGDLLVAMMEWWEWLCGEFLEIQQTLTGTISELQRSYAKRKLIFERFRSSFPTPYCSISTDFSQKSYSRSKSVPKCKNRSGSDTLFEIPDSFQWIFLWIWYEFSEIFDFVTVFEES